MTPLELALRNFPRNYQLGGLADGLSAFSTGLVNGAMGVQTQPTYGSTPFQPNLYGLGMVGAYLGSQRLLQRSNDRNYEAYKNRWIRDYQIPSLIQDPNKFGDQYTSAVYQQGGSISPSPQYNFWSKWDGKKLLTPDATDSAVYRINYNAMRNQEPYALRQYSNYETYGIPNVGPNGGNADPIISFMDWSRYNAYKDAINPTYNVNLTMPPDAHRPKKQKQGGLSREEDYGSKSHPYPSVHSGDFAGPHRSYPIPTHADAVDALRLAHLHGAQSVIAKVLAKYPDLRKKMGGVIKEYQDGGRMTQEQMAQFNGFNQFVNSQGYQGSDKLNNQAFSRNLYSQYQAANPDVKLSYDQMIPLAQREQYMLRASAQHFAQTHGDPNATNLYSNITPADGMYGPKTNSYSFPSATLISQKNGQTTGVQNLGYTSTFGTPVQDDYVIDSSGDLVKRKMKKGGTKKCKDGGCMDIDDVMKKGGNWIQGAVNPKHKGYCTPMTKSTCTGRRRAFAETMKEHHGFHEYGGVVDEMRSGGNWIQGAVNPAHKGYCTPMTKSTCTPRRKALARRFKAMARKQDGGLTLNTPQEQAQGYYAHPNASYLHFPGNGARTFVPGPFPLAVLDNGGTQILDRHPIRTYGPVTEIPIFKEGGEVPEVKTAPTVKRKDATIEAEKGELIFGAGAPGDYEDAKDRVGAGLYKIGGKKHYDGGTPLKAFPGDFVFSNDPKLAFNENDSEKLTGDKPNGKLQRTPAKLANKYIELNKFINMAQDPDIDPISKKTAILNVNNFIDRLSEIAVGQEGKKGFPTGIPAFAQASLQSRGYDQQGLQDQLNQGMMKQGGEVRKYQVGGITDDIYNSAKIVNEAPAGAKFIGKRGMRSYYMTADGKTIAADMPQGGGQPNAAWRQSIIDRVKAGQNPYDLLKNRMIGDPKFAEELMQYYKPQTQNNYYSVNDRAVPVGAPTQATNPALAPNVPVRGSVPDFASMNPPQGLGLTNYFQNPNNKFNINAAEAYGLYAANRIYDSRYPSAYRNYEIGNAKALTASAYSPISEQPYLNAINRSTLGFNQNSTPTSYARQLGAFNSALGAQDQAISQVYAQNQARKDQRNSALSQLEIQDGLDRIQNQSLYDNKLETLAFNREQAAKNRVVNNAALINQMQTSREAKGLFNVMSDFYEIGPNNQIQMKPTYKIENGKVVQVQRNIADLIRSAGATQNQQYINTLENVFQLMNRYGITNGSFVDDVLKQAINPPVYKP